VKSSRYLNGLCRHQFVNGLGKELNVVKGVAGYVFGQLKAPIFVELVVSGQQTYTLEII
jgi:hypothetical protein